MYAHVRQLCEQIQISSADSEQIQIFYFMEALKANGKCSQSDLIHYAALIPARTVGLSFSSIVGVSSGVRYVSLRRRYATTRRNARCANDSFIMSTMMYMRVWTLVACQILTIVDNAQRKSVFPSVKWCSSGIILWRQRALDDEATLRPFTRHTTGIPRAVGRGSSDNMRIRITMRFVWHILSRVSRAICTTVLSCHGAKVKIVMFHFRSLGGPVTVGVYTRTNDHRRSAPRDFQTPLSCLPGTRTDHDERRRRHDSTRGI